MKTVLVVAYYFPPIAASGSMRPLGFCRYLGEYGWHARVLTTEPESVYPPIGVDQSLYEQVPDTVKIDRVPHKNPEQKLLQVRDRLQELVHKTDSFRGRRIGAVANRRRPAETTRGFQAPYLVVRKMILEWLFSFPDPQRFWLQPAVRWLSQIRRSEYPELVFATGGPWTSLLVGQALAKRFRVPFVADFRDPWTNNPNRQQIPTALLRKHRKLEKEVCKAAAKVVSNTEELTAQFKHDHPELREKFTTITNGFEHVPPPRLENRKYQSGNQACQPHIELSHFGSIYGNRNPFPLLSAIEGLVRENRVSSDQLRLRLIGEWLVKSEHCEGLAQKLEKKGFLQRSPSVPHDVCVEQMALAQVLLVLQPGYPLQVPAKIYEYIATGRPILVLGGEGATARFIERHRLGECCRNESEAIKDLLLRTLNGQLRIKPPDPAIREKLHYRNLTQKLAEIFDAASVENR